MDLKAVLLNCTLKPSPEVSNTQALLDIVIGHLEDLGTGCEVIRPADYRIPFGVVSDMGDGDEWPRILDRILAADILIIGTSIWFGVRNSICQMVIERLDGTYESTNDVGQYPMYNKVAGVVVTGNEDGAHAAAETTLFNLSHLGFTIPPNADTGSQARARANASPGVPATATPQGVLCLMMTQAGPACSFTAARAASRSRRLL